MVWCCAVWYSVGVVVCYRMVRNVIAQYGTIWYGKYGIVKYKYGSLKTAVPRQNQWSLAEPNWSQSPHMQLVQNYNAIAITNIVCSQRDETFIHQSLCY